MKKIKLIALVLVGTITTGIVLPAVQVSAETLSDTYRIEQSYNRTLSETELNELNEWMNSLKTDFKDESDTANQNKIQTRGAGKLIVLRAGKWLMKHWNKVVEKSPKWLKPYLGATFAFKVLDKYIKLSDSIDSLVWSVLRELIPNFVPDYIVGGLKNVIVAIIPV